MVLLDVQKLRTYYTTLSGTVKAVDRISFQVERGEGLGLAGESGCGKTTVALSLLRILPSNAKIAGGKIIFDGQDIVKFTETELRKKIRWKGISLVFQGAMNALNPVYRIGDQITEAITLHEPKVTKDEANSRVEKLLEMVGIDPSRASNYPHEFSGGMRQRACIAMALACNPSLLIADEPSTALDVIVQAQVLKLLRELKDKLNLGMVVISHDLSIIAETCQKAAIMYGGKIAEYGDIVKIFKEPLHPYTQGLIGAFPPITAKKMRLESIAGFPPNLINPPPACRFHPRCPYAMDVCRTAEPEMLEASKNHYVSCHLVTRKQ